MAIEEIGCCGAYCKKCRAFTDRSCRGCKLGYDTGERDISRAKCKIKVCCMGRGHDTCANCPELPSCLIINEFYGKKGHKYTKYRQATQFIRDNGYAGFLKIADNWTNAYGKYK